MRYKRSRAKGATCFFTVVTYKRKKILCKIENAALIKEAFKYVGNRHPFMADAFVLLPDHLHCIWTLPDGDNDFSTRWRQIKSHFTRNCGGSDKDLRSASRQKKSVRECWVSFHSTQPTWLCTSRG